MMNKLTVLILLCLFIIPGVGIAQHLSLQEALQIGLEQNFGVQIAENEAEIDRMNRTLGNAGILPSINVTGTGERLFESETTEVTGESRSTEDFEISLLSLDAELDWTIFDGFRMFTTYSKLGEMKELGETLSRVQMEDTIVDIVTAYYEVVRQEKLLGVLENSVEISEERYEIAQTKRELGSGSEYEELLAQSDLNRDRAEMIRQEVILNDARLELIRLLDLERGAEFDVTEGIDLAETVGFDELYDHFLENNREIEAAELRSSISNLEIRELRRERMPEIDFNVGYSLNREETQNNLLYLDQTDGLFVGITARINIFDGFNTNRRVQTAKIRHKNNELRVREEQKNLETTLSSEYKNYENARQLVELENENLRLAEEALEIALEQFQLATITSLELRETQRILFDTENNLIDAQFVAIISETELYRLAGILNERLL